MRNEKVLSVGIDFALAATIIQAFLINRHVSGRIITKIQNQIPVLLIPSRTFVQVLIRDFNISNDVIQEKI